MLQQQGVSGMSCENQIENVMRHQGESKNRNRMLADPGLSFGFDKTAAEHIHFRMDKVGRIIKRQTF
jgi:hypothetical protein